MAKPRDLFENAVSGPSDGVVGRRFGVPLFAALLGLGILYVVGFAQPMVLHNAAHDSRHTMAFPCH